jgi:hypothetical protein
MAKLTFERKIRNYLRKNSLLVNDHVIMEHARDIAKIAHQHATEAGMGFLEDTMKKCRNRLSKIETKGEPDLTV